jgi:hypothetical protein
MKSKFLILVFVLVSTGFISARELRSVPASDVGSKFEITGDLGIPVGKTVTISGRKQRNGPGDNTFRVTSVNGDKKDLFISVIGIENWPEGTEATLSGTEFATLQYFTEPYGNLANNDSRWKGPKQLLSLEFKVDRIVSPANLHLKNQAQQAASNH